MAKKYDAVFLAIAMPIVVSFGLSTAASSKTMKMAPPADGTTDVAPIQVIENSDSLSGRLRVYTQNCPGGDGTKRVLQLEVPSDVLGGKKSAWVTIATLSTGCGRH